MDFGSKLRHLRAQFGFTQAHVAELLNISTRSYGAYELNESQPRSKAGFEKLAAFYHVPLSFLYSDDDFHRNKKRLFKKKNPISRTLSILLLFYWNKRVGLPTGTFKASAMAIFLLFAKIVAPL